MRSGEIPDAGSGLAGFTIISAGGPKPTDSKQKKGMPVSRHYTLFSLIFWI